VPEPGTSLKQFVGFGAWVLGLSFLTKVLTNRDFLLPVKLVLVENSLGLAVFMGLFWLSGGFVELPPTPDAVKRVEGLPHHAEKGVVGLPQESSLGPSRLKEFRKRHFCM